MAVKYIKEVAYGVTPPAGNFETARFTSESLSGTPGTAESQQIRVDRQSSGQVVTSLDVGGDLNFELAKEQAIDDFFESAMASSWQTFTVINADLTINMTAKTITRAAGAWPVTLERGDIITLGGFTNPKNNVQVIVSEVTSSTVIEFAGPDGMVDEVATGTTFEQADKLKIGTTIKSFSMQKEFTDLTTKAIIYPGMFASAMSLSVAHGSIITGTFTFSGNGYDVVDAAIDFITDGRTVNPAATTNSMNGSVDMPFIVTDISGSLASTDFCIQSVEINLDNQVTPKNCIGVIAPTGYSLGTAQVGVNLSAYLENENWEILPKKLDQTPFAVGFAVKNAAGGYGFFMPAVQVSFDDPSSGGQNQDVLLEMQGVAKIGANQESSLTIFRF